MRTQLRFRLTFFFFLCFVHGQLVISGGTSLGKWFTDVSFLRHVVGESCLSSTGCTAGASLSSRETLLYSGRIRGSPLSPRVSKLYRLTDCRAGRTAASFEHSLFSLGSQANRGSFVYGTLASLLSCVGLHGYSLTAAVFCLYFLDLTSIYL